MNCGNAIYMMHLQQHSPTNQRTNQSEKPLSKTKNAARNKLACCPMSSRFNCHGDKVQVQDTSDSPLCISPIRNVDAFHSIVCILLQRTCTVETGSVGTKETS